MLGPTAAVVAGAAVAGNEYLNLKGESAYSRSALAGKGLAFGQNGEAINRAGAMSEDAPIGSWRGFFGVPTSLFSTRRQAEARQAAASLSSVYTDRSRFGDTFEKFLSAGKTLNISPEQQAQSIGSFTSGLPEEQANRVAELLVQSTKDAASGELNPSDRKSTRLNSSH